MKIKNLLVLALTMLGTSLTVQAQVVKEDFSAEQTKASTDQGFYEFINLQPTDEGAEKVDKWTVGDGVLNIVNSAEYVCSGQKWQRAIKFRNLPLKEKTLYKLSFDLKTTETYLDAETSTEVPGNVDMKIMQGDENADICIQGADGSEQRANFQLNAGDEKNYSKIFYFADLAKQNAAYETACAGKELYNPAKFFVGINIYNPGSYVLDNVLLEEAANAVDSVVFNGTAIRVYYIGAINAAALCGNAKSYAFDSSCATVTVNGNPVTIESVEVKSDGYLYIFTEDDLDGEVKVSFTNPGDLAFTGAYAGASLDFADLTADFSETFNEDGSIMSYLYDEPSLVSTVPVDGSFALDQNISEFTFTFDRAISTKKTDFNDVPTATLSDGTELTLTTEDEFSKTLTFTRSGAELAKGSYTVTLSNIASDYGTPIPNDITISFEVGKIHLAKETVTPIDTISFEDCNANSIPDKFTYIINDSELAAAESAWSGPRLFGFATGGDFTKGFYWRTTTQGATSSVTYGQTVKLPKGDVRLQFCGACWKGSGLAVTAELIDANGNVVASQDGSFEQGVSGSTSVALNCDKVTIAYNNADENADYKLRISHVGATSGYEELLFSGVIINTYEKTEGDAVDVVTLFADKTYGGANGVNAEDNCAPKEGSGWALYQNGAKRTAGANFNYNGTRLFSLSVKNLSWGYYTNGSWNNGAGNYIIYGEGGEGEPTLTLPEGQVQITYYANNWKTDGRILYFQLLDEQKNIVYSRQDTIIVGNSKGMDGNRSASVESQKVQFTYNIPATGNYMLKLGGDGEMFVGNYTIEQMPSQAAYYYKLMAAAVEAAQAELAKCADPMYDGTTKSALQADVEKYSGESDMTTADEYKAAIAEVEALTKALSTRRGNISDYNVAMANLETVIGSTVGTKYENLDAYKAANEVYSSYSAVSPSSLEDAELSETTLKLQNYYNWLNNMYSTGVGLLTKQTTDLASQLVGLNEEMAADVSVAKSEESITDDQDLAYILKLKTLKAIYDKCAAATSEQPDYPFNYTEMDSTIMSEAIVIDSIEVTPFIQNANLYATETSTTRNLSDVKNVPGWNININNGSIGVQWSWSTWNGNEYNPVNDVFLLNGWNGDFTIDQNVGCLPVGKYRYVCGTQDRGMADTSDGKTAALSELQHWTVTGTDGTNDITGEIFSYIYWQTAGGEQEVAPFDISGQGQWYDLTNCNSREINVAASTDLPYGELLIGARPISYQSSASVDNFKLYMIGKQEGFDYAKAAAEVQKLIDELTPTAINNVNSDNKIKATYKYVKNGQVVIEKNGKKFNAAGVQLK